MHLASPSPPSTIKKNGITIVSISPGYYSRAKTKVVGKNSAFIFLVLFPAFLKRSFLLVWNVIRFFVIPPQRDGLNITTYLPQVNSILNNFSLLLNKQNLSWLADTLDITNSAENVKRRYSAVQSYQTLVKRIYNLTKSKQRTIDRSTFF